MEIKLFPIPYQEETKKSHVDHRENVESKDELKSLLMRVKEESEKAGLKLNI